MLTSTMRWTGAALAAGLALTMGGPARAAGLSLIRPREGDTVRETVRVEVPASAIPPHGFASLFIDGLFRVAQAPPLAAHQPITFRWDTKETLPDTSLTAAQRSIKDGEHVVEVRTYTSDGKMAERTAVHVRVDNMLPIRRGQPIFLGYKFKVGDATKYAYTYDLKAVGVQNTAGNGSQPGDIIYREFTKVTAFVEDYHDGRAFMRDRRDSPVTISYGDVAQSVPVDESSRYYTMLPDGHELMSSAMTRENRMPMYSELLLPNRSVRVGQSWRSIIAIWNGALATGKLEFPATCTLQEVEWEHGVPTARIKCVYQGSGKLNNTYAGIQNGLIQIKGTSIINFAPNSGKIVRAVHDLTGTLKLDTNAAPAGSSAAPGGPPGYGPPGSYSGKSGPPGYGGAAGSGGPPGYGAPAGGPPGYGGPGGSGGPAGGGPPGYGPPGSYGTPGYDPTANQGGPIPGVTVYQNYSLTIHAVATVI